MSDTDNMNYNKVLSRRLPYYNENIPFICAWSQKSGCTTILKWFLFHSGLLKEALEYRSPKVGLDIHEYEMNVLKAAPGYRKKVKRHLMQDRPVISFIRCPYSRAFSSFMQINNKRFIRQVDSGNISPGCKVRMDILNHIYGEDVSIEYPISFLDYLKWAKDQDLDKTNPHHTPQLGEIHKHKNTQYYKLESFNNAIDEIERNFDLECSKEYRHLFTSEHHTRKETMSRSLAMKILEQSFPLSFSSGTRVPTVDRDLLEGTIYGDLIEAIFHRDIELYDSIS